MASQVSDGEGERKKSHGEGEWGPGRTTVAETEVVKNQKEEKGFIMEAGGGGCRAASSLSKREEEKGRRGVPSGAT